MIKHVKDYNLEPTSQKIQCIYCDKYFDDDDIVSIFDEPICDDCIDYLLKNNVSYLRNILKRSWGEVDKYDVDYLLERLDKINRRSKQ